MIQALCGLKTKTARQQCAIVTMTTVTRSANLTKLTLKQGIHMKTKLKRFKSEQDALQYSHTVGQCTAVRKFYRSWLLLQVTSNTAQATGAVLATDGGFYMLNNDDFHHLLAGRQ